MKSPNPKKLLLYPQNGNRMGTFRAMKKRTRYYARMAFQHNMVVGGKEKDKKKSIYILHQNEISDDDCQWSKSWLQHAAKFGAVAGNRSNRKCHNNLQILPSKKILILFVFSYVFS